MAQFTASGKITDEEGFGVIGASILVQGTTSGTVTDLDGNFSLNIPTDEATLIISYTGYGTREIPVSSANPTVDVTIEPSSALLQEVVVTGYGETDRNNFSGAAAAVELERVAVVPRSNFQESLDGNVAGLQVAQGSGQPGAFQAVQIRGLGSINASSAPLYVIDGIPVISGNVGGVSTTNTPLAGLNPQDIESLQVLKDASATSIYGSRAANGVVVITTKRGKAGKAKIDFNIQRGTTDVSLADKLKPLTGDEYIELFTEGLVNRGDFTEAEAAELIGNTYDTSVRTDWFDEITRQGNFTTANLSARGGTDNLRYFVSGGYQENEGNIPGSDFRRYSSRLNLGTDIAPWFELNVNLSGSYTEQNSVPSGGAFANPVRSIFRLVPLIPLRNDDGSFNRSFNAGFNPIVEATQNKRENNILNLQGTLSANIDLPVDGLTFEPYFSYNSIRSDDDFFNPPTTESGEPLGYSFVRFDIYDNWLVRNQFKYDKRFNDVHGVQVTVGMEAQEFSRNTVSAQGENFAFPSLTTLSNAATPLAPGGSRTANSLVGYYATANYNYNGLVYVNGTFRRDGSSRFGSDNRYANFYSVGVGVNLHRFDFLADNPTITQLRVRSSYGQNGNQNGIGDFASRGLYSVGSDYNNAPGILLSQLENAGLTWEVNKPFNVGVDLGLWDRVNVVADVFTRRTSSLLFDQPVSRTNGVASITTNIGELENRGVELTVDADIIQSPGDGFSWRTSFNFTHIKNEVISLPEDGFADGTRFRETGQPWNTWYTRGYVGANPDNGLPQWYTDETETEITSDFSETEPYEHGTSDPDFFGGFRNTFRFKGFSLTAQLNYRWGQRVLHSWHSFTHADGSRGLGSTGNVARSIYERRWQQPGDITDTPIFVVSRNNQGRQRSTRFLYDGSYITLRDLIVDYTLPRSLTNKWKMSNVRVFVQGSNLWLYAKDDRLERDPRTDASGFIDQEIPIPLTITFGLDASF